MKRLWLVPLAAIVGLVAGSWSSREDLRRLSESDENPASVRRSPGATGFDAFARQANIPKATTRAPVKSAPAASVGTTETNAVAAVESSAEESSERFENAPETPVSTKDLGARLKEAADLWNTRVALAKATWKEKLGATGAAESTAFDQAIASMNEELRESMEVLAQEIDKSERMTPELELRLMGDLTRTMAETYDAIGSGLPESRRDDVSEIPVYEFIDPMVAEPLIGVQDKLEAIQ